MSMTRIERPASACWGSRCNEAASYASTVDFVWFIDDLAKDFYIILMGEVGVFVPRSAHHVIGEINAVDRMLSRIDKKDAYKEDIENYLKDCKEEKDKKDFLAKIVRVYEGNNIELSSFYLQEKLGGLPLKEV